MGARAPGGSSSRAHPVLGATPRVLRAPVPGRRQGTMCFGVLCDQQAAGALYRASQVVVEELPAQGRLYKSTLNPFNRPALSQRRSAFLLGGFFFLSVLKAHWL